MVLGDFGKVDSAVSETQSMFVFLTSSGMRHSGNTTSKEFQLLQELSYTAKCAFPAAPCSCTGMHHCYLSRMYYMQLHGLMYLCLTSVTLPGAGCK